MNVIQFLKACKIEMKLSMIAVAIVLFVCLTPGILFKMPIKASPRMIAVIHGVIFGAALYIIDEASLRANLFENFESPPTCEKGYIFSNPTGKCYNTTTKKFIAPICKAGTTFNPANNMCGSKTTMAKASKPTTGMSSKPTMAKASKPPMAKASKPTMAKASKPTTIKTSKPTGAVSNKTMPYRAR
jgi:hypothetical protein